MAEFVQQRIEEWTEIISEIKRLKLFGPKKIKEIVSEIGKHQHCIQKMTRTLEDVLRFANYQVTLLNEIERARREQSLMEKVQEIDEEIKHKINSLFGQYKRSFSNNLEYWQAKISFQVGQKWLDMASKTYQEATKSLGHKHIFLFEKASTFEWKLNPIKNIVSARNILQEALRENEGNLTVFLWIYELELKHADFLFKKAEKLKGSKHENNYEEDAKKCVSAAKVLYKHAMERYKNHGTKFIMKACVEFSLVVQKYDLFQDLQTEILSEIKSSFPNEVDTYKSASKLIKNQKDDGPDTSDVVVHLKIIQMNDGIGKARKHAKKMMQYVNSYELLMAVADMEFFHTNRELKTRDRYEEFREIMEKICVLYGREHIDVWLKYMEYEARLNNKYKVSEIYSRGLHCLDDKFKEEFMLKRKK